MWFYVQQYISDPDGSLCCADPLGWAVFSTFIWSLKQAALCTKQDITQNNQTKSNQNTHWPFPLHSLWTKLWYFIFLRFVTFCLYSNINSAPLYSKVRLKVCHPLLTMGIKGWTLETTWAIGLFPLLLGALTTPLHAHLLQIALCHPSVVHWNRTVYTGGYSPLWPEAFCHL